MMSIDAMLKVLEDITGMLDEASSSCDVYEVREDDLIQENKE